MKKKAGIITAVLFLVCLIILCRNAGNALQHQIKETDEVLGNAARAYIVLDPGHGGLDAGKTGVNGAQEKEINLKIALYTKKLLEKEGVKVKLTRSDDQRLAETQVKDLKSRVDIMNNENPDLAVSIHQNSYHEENVHGAQVFYYGDSAEGEKAGKIMQNILNEKLQDEKKTAKVNRTYYILKKTKIPVIIVECGFLSNYEEAEKLADKEYQEKISEAVTEGIITYIETGI